MDSEDFQTILKIVDRAKEMKILMYNEITLIADLEVATEIFNLRLKELLEADNFNFGHDIFGIQSHINRNKRIMTNTFVPRFAGQKKYAVGVEVELLDNKKGIIIEECIEQTKDGFEIYYMVEVKIDGKKEYFKFFTNNNFTHEEKRGK